MCLLLWCKTEVVNTGGGTVICVAVHPEVIYHGIIVPVGDDLSIYNLVDISELSYTSM